MERPEPIDQKPNWQGPLGTRADRSDSQPEAPAAASLVAHSRTQTGCQWRPVLGALLCCVLTSLGTGCSHSRDRSGGALTGVYDAQPPRFLRGPMSVLLTNATGFMAEVMMTGDSLATTEGSKSGQLLGRGSKLLFAPAQATSKKNQARAGGFAFIWDVASNSGYVLSGGLEGYAPVSWSVRPTNIVAQAKSPREKTQGHPSVLEGSVVQMDDGTSSSFEVWRATDLHGFPIRISTASDATPLTLTLSNIRLSPPPEDVFMPPEDFRKYSSPEALADEVAAREHNLHRKSSDLNLMEPIRGSPR